MKRLTLLPALLLAAFIPTNILTMAQTQTNESATNGATATNGAATPPAPPVAKKIARTIEVHGTKLSDDYFWMRDKKNPEVISHLEAENAHTDAMTKRTAELQEHLYKEMLARIKQTDTNVPYRCAAIFTTRAPRRVSSTRSSRVARGRWKSPEQVLLDLNEMAKGHTFMGVGEFDVTSDSNLLAYSTDTTGFREYTLYVKDLRTGESTKIAERVSSAAWAGDDKTLFYVIDNQTTQEPLPASIATRWGVRERTSWSTRRRTRCSASASSARARAATSSSPLRATPRARCATSRPTNLPRSFKRHPPARGRPRVLR